MPKKISGAIVFFALSIGILTSTKNTEAADLNVRCRDDESRCSSEPAGVPLFNETNIAPGQVITKTISARNEKSGVCNLKLTVSSENANSDFAKKMYTAITSERGDEFGVSAGGTATNAKNFYNIVSESPIDFGSIDPYNTKNFSWNVKFSEDAANALQGKSTTFDIGLNFTCDEPSESNSGGGGTSSGNGSQGSVAGKTTKKLIATPTPTPTPSVLGNLFSKLRGSNAGEPSATPSATISPSASPSPEVAGDSTSGSVDNFSSSFLGRLLKNWSWIILLLLLLVFLFFIWKRRKDEDEESKK